MLVAGTTSVAVAAGNAAKATIPSAARSRYAAGASPFSAWRRAAAMTAGQRLSILGTAAVLFVLIFGLAVIGGQAFRAVPGANHFVARVLFDCVLAVSQSLFTISLFLFYWRKQGIPAPAVPAAT